MRAGFVVGDNGSELDACDEGVFLPMMGAVVAFTGSIAWSRIE
jgi:hypothetical protein